MTVKYWFAFQVNRSRYAGNVRKKMTGINDELLALARETGRRIRFYRFDEIEGEFENMMLCRLSLLLRPQNELAGPVFLTLKNHSCF